MNNTLCKNVKFNGKNYVSITTQFVRMLIQRTCIAASFGFRSGPSKNYLPGLHR